MFTIIWRIIYAYLLNLMAANGLLKTFVDAKTTGDSRFNCVKGGAPWRNILWHAVFFC